MYDKAHDYILAAPLPIVDEAGETMERVIPLSVGAASYAVRFKNRWTTSGHGQRQVEVLGYIRDRVVEPFRHIPYEDDSYAWLIRRFLDDADDHLVAEVGGALEPISPEAIREVNTLEVVGPAWCPVANMGVERPYGPGGQDVRRGNTHFKPGAKLCLVEVMSWLERGSKRDMQVEVVGRHRGSHRYVKMIVSASWLTNWRAELVYSPHVIRELWPAWDGTQMAKARAQELVELMQVRYDVPTI